jgi:hypothetical protein
MLTALLSVCGALWFAPITSMLLTVPHEEMLVSVIDEAWTNCSSCFVLSSCARSLILCFLPPAFPCLLPCSLHSLFGADLSKMLGQICFFFLSLARSVSTSCVQWARISLGSHVSLAFSPPAVIISRGCV